MRNFQQQLQSWRCLTDCLEFGLFDDQIGLTVGVLTHGNASLITEVQGNTACPRNFFSTAIDLYIMGTTLGKMETYGSSTTNESAVEVDPNNGLLFRGYFFPPEIVTLILSHVETIYLVKNGRRVCKLWRDMIDSVVLREKVLREVPGADLSLFQSEELSPMDFYSLCIRKPFMKNLLKNGSGEEGLKHWSRSNADKIRSGRDWKLEREPVGSDPFPTGCVACFATSFDWCSAEQVISLQEHGLTPAFMKSVRPNIHIEEWYAGRFDCGFEYSLKVTLLSPNWNIIDSFVFETTGHSAQWTKVEHVFSDYKGTVGAIVFHHKGKDTQFWAGHYGSKMTGAKVFVTLAIKEDQ